MTAFNFRLVYAHRFVCRRRECFPRFQAKAGAMTRADDFRSLDCTARQFGAVMSADIVDGKMRLPAARDGDHPATHGKLEGLSIAQIRGGTRSDAFHDQL